MFDKWLTGRVAERLVLVMLLVVAATLLPEDVAERCVDALHEQLGWSFKLSGVPGELQPPRSPSE